MSSLVILQTCQTPIVSCVCQSTHHFPFMSMSSSYSFKSAKFKDQSTFFIVDKCNKQVTIVNQTILINGNCSQVSTRHTQQSNFSYAKTNWFHELFPCVTTKLIRIIKTYCSDCIFLLVLYISFTPKEKTQNHTTKLFIPLFNCCCLKIQSQKMIFKSSLLLLPQGYLHAQKSELKNFCGCLSLHLCFFQSCFLKIKSAKLLWMPQSSPAFFLSLLPENQSYVNP